MTYAGLRKVTSVYVLKRIVLLINKQRKLKNSVILKTLSLILSPGFS